MGGGDGEASLPEQYTGGMGESDGEGSMLKKSTGVKGLGIGTKPDSEASTKL